MTADAAAVRRVVFRVHEHLDPETFAFAQTMGPSALNSFCAALLAQYVRSMNRAPGAPSAAVPSIIAASVSTPRKVLAAEPTPVTISAPAAPAEHPVEQAQAPADAKQGPATSTPAPEAPSRPAIILSDRPSPAPATVHASTQSRSQGTSMTDERRRSWLQTGD